MSLTLKNLRCENRTNPLGIDENQPQLSWMLESEIRAQKQTAYQILVATSADQLSEDTGDLWDTGKVESNQNISIVYQGKPLKSRLRCYWKVRAWDKDDKVSKYSETACWEMGLLDSSNWQGKWINDGKPTPTKDEDFYKNDPVPLFRKEFNVAKTVKSARLYISGLGYYEASINGKRVGDSVLDPGWTLYAKRVLYSTYDVTEILQDKTNAIGIMLGNGWYNPVPMRMWGYRNLREYLTIGRPRFISQLNIEYSDGTSESVVSDESWRVGDGPILRNNIYLGEVYDARCEKSGWDRPSFDDSKWSSPAVATEKVGALRAQNQPPIKITKTLKPVKVNQPKPGMFVFDFGQNFAGWIRLKAKGSAGTEIKLRYSELLYPDGTLNVLTSTAGQIKPRPNIAASGAKPGFAGSGAPVLAYQSDTYILKGDGEESYTPRFTFHGFRYVEVTGLEKEPTLKMLQGLRLNAAVEQVGSFSCSNELFNRIQNMVCWTFLSNLFSIQSDCPTRERFGFGGDIVPTAEAMMFNFDMSTFYPKVVRDYGDESQPEGGLPDTAPFRGPVDNSIDGKNSGPAGWGLAHPFLLGELKRYYGNEQLITEQYEVARKWVDFMHKYSKDYIIDIGWSDHESLEPRPVAFTGTTFFYQQAQIVSRYAAVLGKEKDAKKYADLADRIKEVILKKFHHRGTGRFSYYTQACQAFALYSDLVPPKERQAAIDMLLDEILIRHSGHISTGIFGTKRMLDVLTRIGRADVAYTIVNQKTFPGWGHMLEGGATTLWETWAYSDDTFSHNHPMFGSVSKWFYNVIGGIEPDTNAFGFNSIIIRPQILGDLTWAKTSYKSTRGLIATDWKKQGNQLKLNVEIPVNTKAKIYVPAADIKDVTESGQPAAQTDGLKFLGSEDNRVVLAAGSGKYQFEVKIPG